MTEEEYAMTPTMADRLARRIENTGWEYFRVGDAVFLGNAFYDEEWQADLKDVEQVTEFLRGYFSIKVTEVPHDWNR